MLRKVLSIRGGREMIERIPKWSVVITLSNGSFITFFMYDFHQPSIIRKLADLEFGTIENGVVKIVIEVIS